jgi:hypothetical protein
VTLRVELMGHVTCDAAGCAAAVSALGGASRVTEVARDAGWSARYDREAGRYVHACPRHLLAPDRSTRRAR